MDFRIQSYVISRTLVISFSIWWLYYAIPGLLLGNQELRILQGCHFLQNQDKSGNSASPGKVGEFDGHLWKNDDHRTSRSRLTAWSLFLQNFTKEAQILSEISNPKLRYFKDTRYIILNMINLLCYKYLINISKLLLGDQELRILQGCHFLQNVDKSESSANPGKVEEFEENFWKNEHHRPLTYSGWPLDHFFSS